MSIVLSQRLRRSGFWALKPGESTLDYILAHAIAVVVLIAVAYLSCTFGMSERS